MPLSSAPEVKSSLEFDLPHTSILHHLNVRNWYYYTKVTTAELMWLVMAKLTLLLLSNHNTKKAQKYPWSPDFKIFLPLSYSSGFPSASETPWKPRERQHHGLHPSPPSHPHTIGIFKFFLAKKQTLEPCRNWVKENRLIDVIFHFSPFCPKTNCFWFVGGERGAYFLFSFREGPNPSLNAK